MGMSLSLATALRLSEAPIRSEGLMDLVVSAQCPCGHRYNWIRGSLLVVLADIFEHERQAHGAS